MCAVPSKRRFEVASMTGASDTIFHLGELQAAKGLRR
jgi:hypothetical protein